MNLFLEVVEDLSSFAYSAIRNFLLPSPKITQSERIIAARQEYIPLPEAHLVPSKDVEVLFLEHTPATLSDSSTKTFQKNTVMYTSSLVTPLRSEPGVVGDTVYAMLPYGSMVMVLETQGMWAQVAHGTQTGWVYVDDLEDRAAHVYPSFHIGEKNTADDPATIRVRALLNDEFGAGEVGLPLQPEEYVIYKLLRKGIKISWPAIRPRTPGTWSGILYPQENVEVQAEPVPGALMEYRISKEDEKILGHLAFVEAVFPDQSIQISEVGFGEEGTYNERVLVADEWRALNAAFLSFS